jgi:hypothetical protein
MYLQHIQRMFLHIQKFFKMKNILFTALLIVVAFSPVSAQTEGTLTVTATTGNAGGNYAPKNIVAIWIEDEQGDFVKTLLAYAQTRKNHLNTWEASTTAAGSPFNVVDAITGATKSSHGTRTCTWNAKDVNSTLVADGNYTVRMELTDKNGTGNFSSFSFTKGPEDQTLNPLGVPSFSSISITWEPLFIGVDEPLSEKNYHVYPNPTNGIFKVSGKDIEGVQVLTSSGSQVYSGTSTSVDLSGQPNGIYYVQIMTGSGSVMKKVFFNGR